MENNTTTTTKWNFKEKEKLVTALGLTVRSVLNNLTSCIDPADTRFVISLGHGDPSAFPCFRTTPIAEDAIADAVRSAKFNGYSSNVGILSARRAVAENLSQDLPYKLSPDDIYLTSGWEAWAGFTQIEMRHFNLLPQKEWEVDLNAVESLTDDNTVAMAIINPCGNVAEMARKLGILVISDVVYAHIAFGSKPFVPMGIFGSIAPVITLGSISKRWIVPGCRLGWLVTNDPNGIFKELVVIDSIAGYLNISSDPATFIQGAILEKTKDDFFSKIENMLREDADICYDRIKDIPCITCPSKPQGSMFVMVR
ncbi:hypothetical protein KY285_031255 [Solanum tuberosum]|nr:hypothetical protein KY285_031255 [Solanum tuberosum]